MQKTGMTILYKVGNNLYVNLTNRCPCSCTFCIRQGGDSVYEETEPLWLEHEPTFDEVKDAFAKQDMAQYNEVVFCGYGEPTEALDTLLATAEWVKATYRKPTRLDTNGLGNLVNGRDITPLLKGKFDTVSISLNSSNSEIYLERVRPKYNAASYPAMQEFARNAAKYVPNVVLTTVSSTISKEDEAACAELCRQLGVKYRIREYVPIKKS